MISYFLFTLMIIFLFVISYAFLYCSIYTLMFFKFCASLCFVLIAYFNHKKHPSDNVFFNNIFMGLIFCLFGDIFITPSYNHYFLVLSIICFFICHLFFINGFRNKVPFKFKDILIFSIIYFPFLLFIYLNNDLYFKKYFFLIAIYSLVIALMLSKSLSLISLRKSNSFSTYSIIVGTCLFFISDFILFFIIFYSSPSLILRLLNLLTYYIGQGILALSFKKPYK